MSRKILFSNIGYARGLDGTLWQHISRAGRNFYCNIPIQEEVLGQVKAVMNAEKPDLCCFVEIDKGSFHSAYYNQLNFLIDDEYRYFDIADKYGENSRLGRLPLFAGKSNAFLAREEFSFQRFYFSRGAKRLVYRVELPGDLFIFFAHFSLQAKVRLKQFQEVHELILQCPGDVILLADFNIMQGFSELQPLLLDTGLVVLNKEEEHTFTFYNTKLALDLCICSERLIRHAQLRVIPQPFSDHAALLVEV